MDCRYFTPNELLSLFERKTLPGEIENGHVVGVTEVSNLSMIIEDRKIRNIPDSEILSKLNNVHSVIQEGQIWLLNLEAENISRVLLDDAFFTSFCDKKLNPHELTKRIALYYDINYSYWTDNVYLEAFD
jgi:hypothetical protein